MIESFLIIFMGLVLPVLLNKKQYLSVLILSFLFIIPSQSKCTESLCSITKIPKLHSTHSIEVKRPYHHHQWIRRNRVRHKIKVSK